MMYATQLRRGAASAACVLVLCLIGVRAMPVAAQPVEGGPSALTPRQVLDGLVSGEASLSDHLDPSRGVVLIRYIEPGPEGTPEVIESHHYCGQELTDNIAMLTEELVDVASDEYLECEPERCVYPAMEWGPAIYFDFETRPPLGLVLVSIRHQSEALCSEEWMKAVNDYVHATMALAREQGCESTSEAGTSSDTPAD